MEKLYSTIFIVDISQNPDEVDTVASRIQQLIEDHGGIIKKIDRWGKRRLAYSINKRTHGFYVEIEFSANSRLNIPQILENEYRINDRVLRFMTYIIEKEELIQRAKNAGKLKSAETAESAEAPAEEKKISETRPPVSKPAESKENTEPETPKVEEAKEVEETEETEKKEESEQE
ncbi:MAG: 30S ribosomal protein S6 [Calditrichia bacterium]